MIDVRERDSSYSHQIARLIDGFYMLRTGIHAKGRGVEIAPLADLRGGDIVHEYRRKLGKQFRPWKQGSFQIGFVFELLKLFQSKGFVERKGSRAGSHQPVHHETDLNDSRWHRSWDKDRSASRRITSRFGSGRERAWVWHGGPDAHPDVTA